MEGTVCQPSQADKFTTSEAVARFKDEGRLVFVVEDRVYLVDDEFLHPGGNEVRCTLIDFY
jgi:hypothetical protein